MSSREKFTAKTMRWIFWTLVFFLIVTVTVCIIFYPDPYRFFSQTVSSLGALNSQWSPTPNTVSRWIFTGGFSILAIGTLVMIIGYITAKGFYGKWIKVMMLFIFFIGCVGTAFPCDHPLDLFRIFHVIGAACFVSGFGLFNFVCQLLRYVRKHKTKPTDGKRKFDYYLDLTFVILTFLGVLWYLLSGLLCDLLDLGTLISSIYWEMSEWLFIFNTELSQKVLLFIGVIAAFLIDVDDM